MAPPGNHAVVFGASGVGGWAIVDELLRNFPEAGAFWRVTAVVNRPLGLEESRWPADGNGGNGNGGNGNGGNGNGGNGNGGNGNGGNGNGENGNDGNDENDNDGNGDNDDNDKNSDKSLRPQLRIVSGIDLAAEDDAEVREAIRRRIADADTATHLFLWAYKPDPTDPRREAATNHAMLRRAVIAFEALAAATLRTVVFPGGAKAYGVHLPGGSATCTSPYREEMARPGSGGGGGGGGEVSRQDVHYFASEDFLRERSAGRKWTWCELHTDAVVGFAPRGSAFSLAAFWGAYLALRARVDGRGAKVAFPGTERGYRGALSNEAGADTVARAAIRCALHPEASGGRAFNVADAGAPAGAMTMADRWPRLAAYFGLDGVGPDPAWKDSDSIPRPSEFIARHAPDYFSTSSLPSAPASSARETTAREATTTTISSSALPHIPTGAAWLDGYGCHFDFDRALSLDRIRAAGLADPADRDPVAGAWYAAWDRFREAGLLPRDDESGAAAAVRR